MNNRKLCADHPETVSNLDVLRFGYDIHFILEKRKPITISTAKATEYKNIYTNQKNLSTVVFVCVDVLMRKGEREGEDMNFSLFLLSL